MTTASGLDVDREPVSDDLAEVMRSKLAELTERIAAEIGRHISEYAAEPHESYLEIAETGVSQAIGYFIDRISEPTASREHVDETFQRIGRGEAYAGRSLESLRSAYQLASGIAWKSLHEIALNLQLPSSTLGELGDALFEFMNSLAEQSVLGFQEAQTQLSDAAYQWRERLLDLILSPTGGAREINQLAATGNWTVPTQVVMIAITRSTEILPPPRRLHPRALANLRGVVPMVLVPAPLEPEARADLAGIFAGHTLSIGCPVDLADAASSLRWARRGLELIESGVIEPTPILDCADHMATLWLHAEPLLRQRLSRQVLAPLFTQPPHSRRILAETMLAWLETRGSAPALAAQLGKHAQTVRYRLKRMQELFGDQLSDNDRCFEMYLALRASMPLWQAGELTDDLRPRPARRTDRPGRARS